MIQDQSESNSERGKDKNFYLSEEAGLTPLLAMTQSFEDCDWLVVQEGSKSAFNPLSAKVAKLRQDVILNQIDRSSLYGVISHLYSLPLDGRHVVLRF